MCPAGFVGQPRWIKVEERSEGRQRVRLETRTMDCGAHDYTRTFDPQQRRSLLQIDAPGIDSTARLIVRNGTGTAKANVAYGLDGRATGVVSWVVSGKGLHQQQEEMGDRNRTRGGRGVVASSNGMTTRRKRRCSSPCPSDSACFRS